jgi:hypothetical protein
MSIKVKRPLVARRGKLQKNGLQSYTTQQLPCCSRNDYAFGFGSKRPTKKELGD